MAGELLAFPHNLSGIAMNLEEDQVGVVLLGEYTELKEGDEVKRTGRIMSVPVGDAMIGRVVDALGQPIDDKGPISTSEFIALERLAPGVIERQPVREPMATGLKAIDSMIPIGRGQRELIIGDRQTGKTAIAIDTILNQKESGVICIYVAIGQKESTVANVVATLEKYGAMAYTIVVAASASEPAPLQYIAPNVTSITDGQSFLEGDLFYAGVRPAINVGISVSRVGGNAQIKAMRSVAGRLRLDLAQYRALAAFAQFGSDLDKATQAQLTRGERMVELLKQEQFAPMPVEQQVIAIFTGTQGHLDDVPVEAVRRFEKEFLAFVEKNYREVPHNIRTTRQLSDSDHARLGEAVKQFKAAFKA